MSNIFSMTDTWNSGATVFNAIQMAVTDTAHAAGSLVLNLVVGAAAVFTVDPTGATVQTGNLTVIKADPAIVAQNSGGSSAILQASAVGGNAFLSLIGTITDQILFYKATPSAKARWAMIAPDSVPESGSNVGSNFQLQRYADDGSTLLGTVLAINRASGQVTIGGLTGITGSGLVLPGVPTAANQAATKAYVDGAAGGLVVGTTTITGGTSLNILYNNGGILGDVAPATLTGSLSLFSTTTTVRGLVPGSNNGGATVFLNGNGAWTVPSGSGGGDVLQAAANQFTNTNFFSTTSPYIVTGATAVPGSVSASVQAHSTTSSQTVAICQWQLSAASPPNLWFYRSRGGSVGTQGLLGGGDYMGEINFAGSSGSSFLTAARIRATASGTPSASIMPAAISFHTTVNSTEGITQRGSISASGAWIIGDRDLGTTASTSTPVSATAVLETHNQVKAGSESRRDVDFNQWSNNATGVQLAFRKSRNATIGSHTILQLNDIHGDIYFRASDGTTFQDVANIQSYTDTAPGASQACGNLVFKTRALGAALTTAFFINSAGVGNFPLTTDSTTTSNGAVVINGGLGVAKQVSAQRFSAAGGSSAGPGVSVVGAATDFGGGPIGLSGTVTQTLNTALVAYGHSFTGNMVVNAAGSGGVFYHYAINTQLTSVSAVTSLQAAGQIVTSTFYGVSPSGTWAEVTGIRIQTASNIMSGTPAVTISLITGMLVNDQTVTGTGVTMGGCRGIQIKGQTSGQGVGLWVDSGNGYAGIYCADKLLCASIKGMGYDPGAGGAVTQGTSRTTGVTLDKACGAVTLFSAAGSTTFQTFTVSSTSVAVNDSVIVTQKSGADKYEIHVTRVAAGQFDVTYRTTGGTTTEQPVFQFSVIKSVIT